MKRKVKKLLLIPIKFILIVILLLMMIFVIRLVTPTEIDDISPEIPCPEIEKYNPDVLYVIPNYNDNPLSEKLAWCNYILAQDKKLALHGLKHTYREFLYENITQEELGYGISEFEKCFGYTPEVFKPPQLKISKENKILIKENNLKRRNVFNQITHKVYHCDDSDYISNKLINIF